MGEKLRMRYEKKDSAVYISHLDLMSCMRRSLLRAGISLRYSSGFNPHPYISVALPLQVGCASLSELLDFEPEDASNYKEMTDSLNRALPEGLKALEVYLPEMKYSTIAWIDISGELNYDMSVGASYDNGIVGESLRNGAAGELNNTEPMLSIADRLIDCFSGGALIITKKTKSGSSDLDIAPFIKNVSISAGESMQLPTQETVRFSARVSAQNPSITPNDILSAMNMRGIPAPYNAVFTRIQLLDSDMCVFR